MRVVLLAGIVAVLSIAPFAGAHGGSHVSFQQKLVDATLVRFGLDAPVVQAETPIPVVIELADSTTGEAPRDVAPTVTATGPAGARFEVPVQAGAAPGAFTGNATFPARGVWNVSVAIDGASEPATFTAEVFPRSDWIVESAAAQTDVYYAGDVRLPIQIYDLRTRDLATPVPGDAVARVEKWTDDHATKINERTERLTPSGTPGEVVLETTLESGMHHIFVGAPSLGFAPGDRPYVHLYVLPADENPDAAKRDTPLPGPAALAIALLAGAVLAARRNRA